MKARILGLKHPLQWKDTTRNDLRDLLSGLLAEEDADLITEEAPALPTTVAQRLAFQLNKPWLNVAMDECQRRAAGIYDELAKRPVWPFEDDNGNHAGRAEGYLPNADQVRENHWISQIIRLESKSVIILCGVIHLSPLAKKLRSHGYEVKEIDVCKVDWCIKEFGGACIDEADGDRSCKDYDPGKQP